MTCSKGTSPLYRGACSKCEQLWIMNYVRRLSWCADLLRPLQPNTNACMAWSTSSPKMRTGWSTFLFHNALGVCIVVLTAPVRCSQALESGLRLESQELSDTTAMPQQPSAAAFQTHGGARVLYSKDDLIDIAEVRVGERRHHGCHSASYLEMKCKAMFKASHACMASQLISLVHFVAQHSLCS